ncbi:Probable squalene synthase [Taphrina deformans PYCC 5710]|uniref:Squalene synthase n=1 Tax=Taphrina deformans (strain PYCC 5710 / ATCC 11124 / CBS 356.35 / IMI 108563 / JCM 9778 / NBRC 8474) TaxID=1097556 RepID=R4X7R7_TAPDE|nr:Probable squalene synthase [Taphrina deformans PYCC 5710]|eukprot:CCG81491.1 Probable squalene synthase [Taphrina deformans PYCC 5710]
MGLFLDLLRHPTEARAVVQYKIWHDPLNARVPEKECETLRRCYELLDLTSRSFSAVIQELDPELRDAVMIFYLVLRALDTVEDDMTLPLSTKLPVLRSFHEHIASPGWNFKDNGPNEKDRQLCVEFEVVVEEYNKLKPAYREVIKDICKEMGEGMAYYSDETISVITLADFDKYCHYVAGLVGEGLSRLFANSGLENEKYGQLMDLSNSMGLFLQKTNIIRDFREDLDDGRTFWPEHIWSKYAADIADLAKPENKSAALNCISEMTCNALEHATDVLLYLSGLRNQSVFNFCAIPQVMAIASLSLVFRNPDVFQKNVKIRKGQACQMINGATNLRYVADLFVENARLIHKKNHPSDPNFLRVSQLCGRIEQWVIDVFPPEEQSAAAIAEKRLAGGFLTPEEQRTANRDSFFLIVAVLVFWLFMGGLMIFAAWLLGARFDLAWAEMMGRGIASPDGPASVVDVKAAGETVAAAARQRLEEL